MSYRPSPVAPAPRGAPRQDRRRWPAPSLLHWSHSARMRPHKSGIQLADPVARNALPIWPDPSVTPAPEPREIPVRARAADAFTSTVGKKPARAAATASAVLRNAASAAATFWFEISTWRISASSTGSLNTDHHAPRSSASAGRASRQPSSHLYEGGTGAAGRTYSGPTVHAVKTRQTVNARARTIGTRQVGSGIYAGTGRIIPGRRRSRFPSRADDRPRPHRRSRKTRRGAAGRQGRS